MKEKLQLLRARHQNKHKLTLPKVSFSEPHYSPKKEKAVERDVLGVLIKTPKGIRIFTPEDSPNSVQSRFSPQQKSSKVSAETENMGRFDGSIFSHSAVKKAVVNPCSPYSKIGPSKN